MVGEPAGASNSGQLAVEGEAEIEAEMAGIRGGGVTGY